MNKPVVTSAPQISVCICTYRRPEMLLRLLKSVSAQEGLTTAIEIVVADNDAGRSAECVVEEFARTADFRVTYCHQPEKNIALTRNCAIAHATGEFIAFIDDDEFATSGWLRALLDACSRYEASGVLGPVRPHFDSPPPAWIIRGRFCERPEPPTGTVMAWNKSRTGNLFFRRAILDSAEEPFDRAFGTGGEDVDFFRRMTAHGCRFVWCNEAAVFESVPPSRMTRRYMLQRALLRGRNSLKFRSDRFRLLLTSFVALPIYSAIIPVAVLFGQHHGMNFCIRFCDHFGRILTVIRANPMKERPI